MDRVDLYVMGPDFYRGSTSAAGRLKDGWCDFKALGSVFARSWFGTSRIIGNVWYLAERVPPSASRSFEEHVRQQIWLRSLGPSVTQLVTAPPTSARGYAGASTPGRGNSGYPDMEAMIANLRMKPLAHEAIVISADEGNQTPLLEFLNERFDRSVLHLIPPDLKASGDAVQFHHDDLAAAQLDDEELWLQYRRSKEKARLAGSLANSEDLVMWLTRKLAATPRRDPHRWLGVVRADAQLRAHLNERITSISRSRFPRAMRTKDFSDLISFVTKSLIDSTAELVLAGRQEQYASDPTLAIDSGSVLIRQAPQAFPRIEFCHHAEKQILALSGSEKYFRWVVKSIAKANEETQAWDSGPFPHERLPGPATGESATVRSNPKLRGMRCFRTRRGELLFFEHHMKCFAENIRIQYVMDQDRRLMLIGYVGEHLPTALF